MKNAKCKMQSEKCKMQNTKWFLVTDGSQANVMIKS